MSEWKKVKIGDFLKRKRIPIQLESDKEYKLITIKLYHKGVYLRGNKKGSEIHSNMYKVSKGDFILSGIDARNGAFGIVPDSLDGAIVTNDFWYFDIDELIIKKEFFLWLTSTPVFLDACQKSSMGETQRIRLQKDAFFNYQINCPSIEYQDDFLAKINPIIEKIKIIQSETEKQTEYAKLLRQNILQEAIEGKLTTDWRKQNPVQKGNPDYDAEALFEQIQDEKKYLLATKELKKGNLPKAIRSNKDLLKYPDSWKWARIDDLFFVTKLAGFEFTQYFHLTESGDIPVVRAQNVRDLTLNKSNLLYIDSKTSELLERSALTKTSLLVTFIGAGIGDVGIFEEKERWHLAPNVAKLEPLKNCEKLISIKLVALFMLSSFGQKEIFKYMKATAQPSLSMESIRDICFPLPPLAEQNEIVTRVENHLQTVSDLENQITKHEQLIKQLMQSILKEAFKEN